MSQILVIVESPGKITKIQSILGAGYIVKASVGHIIDLDPKTMSVKIEENFEPIYKTITGKAGVIDDLRKYAKTAKDVLLAADEDREGEMIAWSVAHMLKLKNPKRIVFNSITKAELLNAVQNAGQINQDMVDAQKARRILDRIVGYEISPLMMKHVNPGAKSAGRVQSVVVRLIIDKEDEIKQFWENGVNSFFRFKGTFLSTDKKPFVATLHDLESEDKEHILKGGVAKMDNSDDSRAFLKNCMGSVFKVHNVFDKKSLRSPSPPFTTSTLQQEASRKLGFAVKRTMTAAQHLYEEGFITYMRTDSVNLSKEAVENIKKFVNEKYGPNYYQGKVYSSAKGTQEAHEAVRPTDVFTISLKQKNKIGDDEIRLYNLIWRRTVASQMKPAEFNVTSIQITISKDAKHFFLTSIENLIFPGFLAVYNIKNVAEEEEEGEGEENVGIQVPPKGTELKAESIVGTEEYQKPPSRYTEASLVDKLDPKNLNIGRPSTYASIISKILDRGYVTKEDIEGEEKDSLILKWTGNKNIVEETQKVVIGKEKSKFVPSALGRMANDFLMKYFPKIMDYKFTAHMEENLDKIAEGKVAFVKVLDDFYKDFHPQVVAVQAKAPILEDKYTKALGEHPDTGAKIIATVAKYGPIVKMISEEGKPEIAPIKKPLTLDNVTLEDALKLFEYPKFLGKIGNAKVYLKRGKFGFYIQVGDAKYSVEDGELTLEGAIAVVEAKKKKNLAEFKGETRKYAVLEGPYGKYIKVSDLKKKGAKEFNVKLPEDEKIEELTLEKVEEIVTNYFAKKKTRFQKKAPEGGAKTDVKEKTPVKNKTVAKKAETKKPVKKVVKKVAQKKKINIV